MKFYDLKTEFTFGKFEGKTLEEVLNLQPDYIDWCAKNLDHYKAEEALENLIQSIMLNKQAYDEIARKVCVALFHRWGEHHPLTQKYRRRFSMALY